MRQACVAYIAVALTQTLHPRSGRSAVHGSHPGSGPPDGRAASGLWLGGVDGPRPRAGPGLRLVAFRGELPQTVPLHVLGVGEADRPQVLRGQALVDLVRSEERRVGKGRGARGWAWVYDR